MATAIYRVQCEARGRDNLRRVNEAVSRFLDFQNLLMDGKIETTRSYADAFGEYQEETDEIRATHGAIATMKELYN